MAYWIFGKVLKKKLYIIFYYYWECMDASSVLLTNILLWKQGMLTISNIKLLLIHPGLKTSQKNRLIVCYCKHDYKVLLNLLTNGMPQRAREEQL